MFYLFFSLARSLVRRRRQWIKGVTVVAVLSAALGARLSTHLDSADFLPRHAEDDLRFEDVLRMTGHGDPLLLTWRSEEPISPTVARPVLETMANQLTRIDGVVRVDFEIDPDVVHFVHHTLPRHAWAFVSPDELRLFAERIAPQAIWARINDPKAHSKDPLGLAPLLGSVSGPRQRPRLTYRDGLYGLRDDRTYLMIAYTRRDYREMDKASRLVDAVEAVVAAAEQRSKGAARGTVIGVLPTMVQTYRQLVSDGRRIAAATSLFVLLALVIFFRSVKAALVLFVPIAAGLTVAAAVTYAARGSVSVVAWIFAAIVVGLGVDFGIHVLTQFQRSLADHGRFRQAVLHAVSRPGPAIMYGAVTSAAALASLAAIDYPVMTDIAWLTGSGVLAVGVSTFVVLPLVMPAGPSVSSTPWDGALFSRAGRWFAQTATRSRPLARSGAVGLVILAVMFAGQIRFEGDPQTVLRRSVPAAEAQAHLGQRLGSGFVPLVMVSQGHTLEDALARDRHVVRQLHQVSRQAAVAFVDSVGQWWPDSESQARNLAFIRARPALFSADRFTSDFRAAVARTDADPAYLMDVYLPRITQFLRPSQRMMTVDDLRAGLQDKLDRHVIRGPDGVRVVTFVYLQRSPPVGLRSFERFQRAMAAMELDDVLLLVPRPPHAPLRGGLTKAVLLTLAAVVVLLWLQFRSLRAIGACLTPLVCGLSTVALLMAGFNIPLDLVSLAIAPVLIGVGVDDGMHVVHRLRAGQTSIAVVREAGPALTLTTVTTAGAMLCLTGAEFGGLRQFGWIAAAGLVVCWGASLYVVPDLYAADRSRKSAPVGR